MKRFFNLNKLLFEKKSYSIEFKRGFSSTPLDKQSKRQEVVMKKKSVDIASKKHIKDMDVREAFKNKLTGHINVAQKAENGKIVLSMNTSTKSTTIILREQGAKQCVNNTRLGVHNINQKENYANTDTEFVVEQELFNDCNPTVVNFLQNIPSLDQHQSVLDKKSTGFVIDISKTGDSKSIFDTGNEININNDTFNDND